MNDKKEPLENSRSSLFFIEQYEQYYHLLL